MSADWAVTSSRVEPALTLPSLGLAPEGGGDMAGNEPDTAEDIDDDEDDWMKYANAGFGETDYSLWDDVEPVEEDEAHQQEVAMQLGTHVEEILGHPAQPDSSIWFAKVPATPVWAEWAASAPTVNHWKKPERVCGTRWWNRTAIWPMFEKTSRCAPFARTSSRKWTCSPTSSLTRLSPTTSADSNSVHAFPKDQMEEEENLRKRLGAGGSEPLKSSLVDEIGKRLKDRLDGITMVSDKPDVLALIDVLTLTVELDVRAVYVYGRYRKLERGIPQTRWPCRACKGRGCERCNHTGLQYEKSVQDLVGNPMLEIFQGTEHAFHGMGREDIDVRCLGRGRPFVLEIKEPRKRSFNAEKLADIINEAAQGSVEVSSIRPSSAAKSCASRTRRLRNPTPFASRLNP